MPSAYCTRRSLNQISFPPPSFRLQEFHTRQEAALALQRAFSIGNTLKTLAREQLAVPMLPSATGAVSVATMPRFDVLDEALHGRLLTERAFPGIVGCRYIDY